VKYNGVEQDLVPCETDEDVKHISIAIDTSQDIQEIEVEMEALEQGGDSNTVSMAQKTPVETQRWIQIMIPNVAAAYDTCMEKKCLQALVNGEDGFCELRTSNQLKWDCLNAETAADVDAIDCCGRWRKCLDDDTEENLKKKFNGMYSTTSLVQAGAKSHGGSKDDSCTCDDSESCQNPDTFDVMKTDCEECWEWTDDATELEIEEYIRSEPKACCSWKNNKGWGCTPTGATLLEVNHSLLARSTAVGSAVEGTEDNEQGTLDRAALSKSAGNCAR
jgi:hypothetical protein